MKDAVVINHALEIPWHELEITASRSGGAGGQHVNKTSTKITVRWNVHKSSVLTAEQKERIVQKLHARLTTEGDLVISDSSSRSQQHNKSMALQNLARIISKALHVHKKRTATRMTAHAKEKRLHEKSRRSGIKQMRSKKNFED